MYRHLATPATAATMGVCRTAEWPALDAAQPNALELVQAGIASEGLAERIARGTTGDTPPRANAARPVAGRWGSRPADAATLPAPVPVPAP